MAPRWSDAMNMKFLKLYREHECLWDQFNQLYKNKYSRESALTVIANEMDLEEFGPADVNRKIKALRATYHSEMKKHLTSRMSACVPEEIYTPSLKWFEEMKHIMTSGTIKRGSNSNEVSIKREPDRTDDHDGVASVTGELVGDEDYYRTEQDNFGEPLQPELIPTIQPIATIRHTPMKRFKRRPTGRFVRTVRDIRQPNRNVPTRVVQENEFDIFGKHVASQLKQLKVEHAVTAIGEINNILMQKRLATLFGRSTCSNSNPQGSPSSQLDTITSEDVTEDPTN